MKEVIMGYGDGSISVALPDGATVVEAGKTNTDPKGIDLVKAVRNALAKLTALISSSSGSITVPAPNFPPSFRFSATGSDNTTVLNLQTLLSRVEQRILTLRGERRSQLPKYCQMACPKMIGIKVFLKISCINTIHYIWYNYCSREGSCKNPLVR